MPRLPVSPVICGAPLASNCVARYASQRRLYAVLEALSSTLVHVSDDAHTAEPSSETREELHANDPTGGAGADRDRASIPPSIELAWGLRDRGTRGPKPGLTLERIVAAGIKVALTDGIGAVSMARVASELGVGTMSLYRYVAAKDELLTLMVDAGARRAAAAPSIPTGLARGAHALGRRGPRRLPPPPLVAAGADQRAAARAEQRRLARGRAARAREHPALRAAEALVHPAGQRVRPQRRDADRRLAAGAAGGASAGGAGGGEVMPGYGAMLSRLIDAASFPALTGRSPPGRSTTRTTSTPSSTSASSGSSTGSRC